MKKITYFITMLFLAFGLSSCEDFFDTSSSSDVDLSSVGDNPLFFEEQMQVIYGSEVFGGNKSYRNRLMCGYQGLNTDIEFNGKTGSAELEACRYNMKLTNGAISTSDNKDPWGYLNKAITQCNGIIDAVDTTTTNPKIKYLWGEALTLRAFVYLDMIKFWGDVPVNNGDAYPIKKDRNIIFEQIRVDLKKAADLMGWSEDIAWAPAKKTISRPNKAFALGLLARANMMYAGYALRPNSWIVGGGASYGVQLNVKDANKRKELYQEALNACGEVIAHYGDTKLKSTFDGVFKDICQDNTSFAQTEWLWAMPFGDDSRGQFMNYNCPKSSEAAFALVNNAVANKSNSVQLIVPTFIYDFEAGDARKWVTVAPFSWVADNAAGISSDVANRKSIFAGSFLTDNAAEKILYQKNVDINKAYLGKYRVEWMSRSFSNSGGDDGVDYPVMRYADILLMYAEASIGGNTADVPAVTSYPGAITPQEAFDKVRARAGLASKTLNITNIIDERAFEFCGEYIRKYDLERWGILKSKLVATTARLTNLDNHVGEFDATSDYIYIKYKNNDALVYPNSSIVTKGYEIDQIYGLAKGENSKPADYDSNPDVWAKKNAFGDVAPRALVNNYLLYTDESKIDQRHYWPIFQVNVASSNGSLWNDYGY